MSFYRQFVTNLPSVRSPTQKRLSFKEKLKWTLVILCLFFILGTVPLFGLDPQYQFRFEQLALILGAVFGSIISLGIGPIVTASIVLQLLNGSGILKFDMTTQEGKAVFQGTQKLLAFFFVVFEAAIYVFLGGLAPTATLPAGLYVSMQFVLIFQLILGGLLIMLMDEVVQKWGFGSGLSLFIVAGVSQSIFIQLLSPLDAAGKWALGTGTAPVGKLFSFFLFLSQNQPLQAVLEASAILATVVVFVMAVYTQAMKIEIPLSFGRVRGYGMRWPLKFIYTSNIPVILIAALMANIQLWGQLLENWATSTGGAIVDFVSIHIVGQINTAAAGSGLMPYMNPPNVVSSLISSTLTMSQIQYALGYGVFLMAGAVLFSVFWVQTSGQDARSVAKQMMSSGLRIPGFRKDIRILERILARYIGPLTVMGAIAVGALAALADLSGALSRGTGILLAVMIIYQMYEQIAKEHMMDMNPAMRKFIA